MNDVMGMTRGLQRVDVTAHPLKGLISRPHTVLFSLSVHPPFHRSFSSQLFSAVGAGTDPWLLGISSPSPHLSPFFPPAEPSSKSLPSSLIPLSLLHRHNASSTQTNHRHRGDLSRPSSFQTLPRSLSRPCGKLAVVGGYIIIRLS